MSISPIKSNSEVLENDSVSPKKEIVLDFDDSSFDGSETPFKSSSKNNRFTTDLVRVYLQEIGRVPLLGKDEEVSVAQKVQAYMGLLEQRNEAAKKGDEILTEYNNLIEIHDRLVSQLNHRPSLEKWASSAKMSVVELKQALAKGKAHWANTAGIEVKKLERIQKIGIQAKEKMIKANLRLVVSVAKKYQNRGLELLDLIQEGTLGLERAVDKFDPTKGYRFSTYAYWWIRQGMTRAIATQSRTIRIPVHITEKLNKIKKAQRQLSQVNGHTPSLDQIAKELEITTEQIREVLAKVPRSVSLDIKVGKEKDTELGDLLETDSASPEDLLIREGLQRELQDLLTYLTDREKEVIELRFGLKTGKTSSLAEIGRRLELSRERVRQIETKAMQKLRQPKNRNRVRDYLDSLD